VAEACQWSRCSHGRGRKRLCPAVPTWSLPSRKAVARSVLARAGGPERKDSLDAEAAFDQG